MSQENTTESHCPCIGKHSEPFREGQSTEITPEVPKTQKTPQHPKDSRPQLGQIPLCKKESGLNKHWFSCSLFLFFRHNFNVELKLGHSLV